MKRVRQLVFRYGTAAALLLMCGALSFLTLGDQHPTGEAAARQMGRRLQADYSAGRMCLSPLRTVRKTSDMPRGYKHGWKQLA